MSAQRILLVEASVGGVVGGSLTGILPLLEHLDRSRFAPALALFESKPIVADLTAHGVPVHILPPLPVETVEGKRSALVRVGLQAKRLFAYILPRARALATLFQREQPALVYLVNGLTANLDGVLAASWCGIPVICHEKGFRRVGPIERWASRRVDVEIGMTDEIVEHYRAARVRARRFVTIFDGIDCQEFRPGGGAAVRAEFGIPAGAPLVGIVGHLQDWKGQHLVAEAVAQALRRHPDLRCLMVGGVHRFGAAYAAALEARIAQPDLAGRVILTGARRDIPACLDAMDVVIHSSVRREPFGRVLIEAMALGKPLVAPREGGPRYIVADGETGLLVPPRDAGALADALGALLDDPARRAAMGRAARARVDTVFDIRHHVAAMQQLFDDILGTSAVPAARVRASA